MDRENSVTAAIGRGHPELRLAAALALLATGVPAQAFGPLFPVRTYEPPGSWSFSDEVAFVDMDGDGAQDVLVQSGPGITVWLNDHRGGLALAPGGGVYGLGFGAFGVGCGDLDGDGSLDAVVPYENGHGYGVLPGAGDGSLGAAVMQPLPGDGGDIELADLDGDGHLDAAIAQPFGHQLAVLSGDGVGGFGAPVLQSSGGFLPFPLRAGDLDLDGDVDLVVGNQSSEDVAVLLNAGDGTLGLSQLLPCAGSPVDIELPHLNADGLPDLALMLEGSSLNRVQLAQALAGGGFGPALSLPSSVTSAARFDLVTGDMDGDGDTDLVLGGGDEVVTVVFREASGWSDPPRRIFAGDDPELVTVGDLDDDGRLDVAAVCDGDVDRLAVLINDGSGQVVAPPVVVAGQDIQPTFELVDLDLDGAADVVAVGSGPFGHRVSVQLGDGAGGFAAAIETEVFGNSDNSPDDLVVDDLDGDGLLDVCIIDSTGDRVQFLPGLGDGSFGAQIDSAGHFDPTRIESGDLDGDGVPDLALAHGYDNRASFMLGQGDGSFGPPLLLAVGDEPEDLALGLLDGDSVLDLAVASWEDEQVRVFGGQGDGSFQLRQLIDIGRPRDLELADITGDGVLDLLVSTVDASFSVHRGQGNGLFVPTGDTYAGSFESIADMDLDGHADLLGNPDSTSFSVTTADGQGGFGAPQEFALLAPGGLGVADFDGDGVPDVMLSYIDKVVLFGRLDPRWIDLGDGLPGTLGQPVLQGAGSTVAGQPITVDLGYARPNSTAWLVLGLSELSATFKGGTLVPSPDVLIAGLPVDGAGELSIATTWPAGLPSGLPVFLQEWVVDPLGPAGFAATNGVRATAE